MKNNKSHTIIIISLLFILSRILIISSLTFIKTGPFSPDQDSMYRLSSNITQVKINQPFESIYMVASADTPCKVNVFINQTNKRTLSISKSIQEFVIKLSKSDFKTGTPLSYIQFISNKPQNGWKIWEMHTDTQSKTNIILDDNQLKGFSEKLFLAKRNNNLNYVQESLMKWDAGWYRSIIEEGYHFDGNYKKQQNVGFLSFYPGMAFVIHKFFRVTASTALLIINNFLTFLSLFVLYYLSLNIIKDPYLSFIPSILLILNPFEIFLAAGYSEGSFIFFSTLCLLFLFQKKYFYYALASGFLSGIRTVGIILPLLLFIDYLLIEKNELSIRSIVKLGCLSILSMWGFLIHMAYMYYLFGDPLVYIKIQKEAWIIDNQTISNFLVKNIKDIFLNFDLTNPEQIGLILFYGMIILSSLYLLILWRKQDRSSILIALYSLLILLTPFFTRFYFNYSMGRYTLVSYPLFILLSNSRNKYKILLLFSWICISIFELSVFSMRFAYWHTPF